MNFYFASIFFTKEISHNLGKGEFTFILIKESRPMKKTDVARPTEAFLILKKMCLSDQGTNVNY